MHIFSLLLEILFFLNITLAAFIIFLERRNPSTTWAWLMVLVFIPVLGFLLYLIFGQNLTRRKMFIWSGREKIGITSRVKNQIQMIKSGTFPFKNEEIAALSGVDVRVMIPNKPDHMFVYWATYSNIGELLKAGARVYIYQNGFIHAKSIVADDKLATVGTANIDPRSFRLNFEVNAFLYSNEQAKELRKIFEKDMELSTELTMEDYQNRSVYIKLKESISRLLSPIL